MVLLSIQDCSEIVYENHLSVPPNKAVLPKGIKNIENLMFITNDKWPHFGFHGAVHTIFSEGLCDRFVSSWSYTTVKYWKDIFANSVSVLISATDSHAATSQVEGDESCRVDSMDAFLSLQNVMISY